MELEDVKDFFPQDYFPEEEQEVVFTAWEELPFTTSELKERKEQDERHRRQRLQRNARARELREQHKLLEPVKPRKPARHHYLPNPQFPVLLGSGQCHKVGVTWVYRDIDRKWVLLKKTCYNRVLGALMKHRFQQYDHSAFAASSFTAPVQIVKLFNFFDPIKGANDSRFFWVETTFNSKTTLIETVGC